MVSTNQTYSKSGKSHPSDMKKGGKKILSLGNSKRANPNKLFIKS